jgi:hypothetical protein
MITALGADSMVKAAFTMGLAGRHVKGTAEVTPEVGSVFGAHIANWVLADAQRPGAIHVAIVGVGKP